MISQYYINLNGVYGSRLMNYPTMKDLLDFMDKMGIWQTTATCLSGNACISNENLRKDLQEVPGAAERVIPAFYAEPQMYISNGEIEQLMDCFEHCSPACLRLTPKTGCYRLREMEFILKRLEPYHPVILLTKSELVDPTDTEDLVYLAKMFPMMKFVVQQVIWGRLHIVFDAMLRADNIFMDNAWLHIEDGTRTMVKQFGPKRLLFSLGPKANAGAAVAGLCRANIPQEQKDAIASDNFIDLFDREEDRALLRSRRRSVKHQIRHRYWDEFLEEKPLKELLVIDSHTHIAPHQNRWFSPTNRIEEQVQVLLADMDRFGIDLAVSSNPNRMNIDLLKPNADLLKVTEGHHDRLKGYLTYIADSPEMYTEEYLDKMFSTGYFIGFKSLPEYQEVDIADPRYIPMFRYADRHGLPILLHTWDSPYGTARQCAEAARPWKNCKLILGHSGGGDSGRRQCEAIAQDPELQHVYFEFCGSFFSSIPWEETLKKIDYHRVLFGTDTHNHDIGWEMGRLLSADVEEAAMEAILGLNARKVLGLRQKRQCP